MRRGIRVISNKAAQLKPLKYSCLILCRTSYRLKMFRSSRCETRSMASRSDQSSGINNDCVHMLSRRAKSSPVKSAAGEEPVDIISEDPSVWVLSEKSGLNGVYPLRISKNKHPKD